MSAGPWVAWLIPIVGIEEKPHLKIVRLIRHRRSVIRLKYLFEGRLSPARAASHVCVQPSCEDTGFDMLSRFDTEAADVIGIFQAVIGLVFFPRVLADSEETLLRKVPMCGSKVGKEEVAINAWRRE